jgi:hypothetical protein
VLEKHSVGVLDAEYQVKKDKNGKISVHKRKVKLSDDELNALNRNVSKNEEKSSTRQEKSTDEQPITKSKKDVKKNKLSDNTSLLMDLSVKYGKLESKLEFMKNEHKRKYKKLKRTSIIKKLPSDESPSHEKNDDSEPLFQDNPTTATLPSMPYSEPSTPPPSPQPSFSVRSFFKL